VKACVIEEAQMVKAVQESARIHTHEEGEHAVRATLRVLGQRLACRDPADLAVLPRPMAAELPEEGGAERFGVEELYRRIAVKEPVHPTPEIARRHARAVVAAIKNSIDRGEFEDIVAQPPDEYVDLLGTGPVVHS
jgi:uncharacterized protein (DUF2267 family)